MEYRGYLIEPSKSMPTLYKVATTGQGGKIPAILDGLFTSTGIIKDIIDAYVDSKNRKGAKNGEAGTESRD